MNNVSGSIILIITWAYLDHLYIIINSYPKQSIQILIWRLITMAMVEASKHSGQP